MSGEREAESEAGVGIFFGGEAAAVSLDDGAADGEPHPHARGLGGEEGFEELLELIGTAGAAVADGDLDLAGFDLARFHGNAPLVAGQLADGVDGVGEQVNEDLLYLHMIDWRRRQAGCELEVELYVVVSEVDLQQRGALAGEVVRVGGAFLRRRFADEAVHAANDLAGALRLGHDLLEPVSEVGAGDGFGLADAVQTCLAEIRDGVERLVELVGDFGDERAHRRESRDVSQLGETVVGFLFHADAIGDIGEHAEHAFGAARVVAIDAALGHEPPEWAIRQGDAELDLVIGGVGCGPVDGGADRLAIVGVDGSEEVIDGMKEVAAREAEKRTGLFGGAEAVGLQVPFPGAHVRGFEGEAESFFAVTELFLGAAFFVAEALFIEGAGDGGGEARHTVFEEIIDGAALDAIDGDLFADAAGDDDERDIEACFFQD